jgi:cold shock CspA family protein
MGRSHESWNKKETAKKKEKKRKDKEKRREERGTTTRDGNSLDEMIAYVDESGNITSTPPDPGKKEKIKSEDIVIGVPKREDLEPENPIRVGIVTFYNDSKGYGFIKDLETQESVFVHVNEMIDEIGKDNKVTFEVESRIKGKNAIAVRLFKEPT